jgi:2-phospho-L-lactate guanylyltransferase
MDAGLLPVKRLVAAKSRLGEVFDAEQRFELASALLDDSLDLAERADFLDWFVISADPQVLDRARDRGFGFIEDPEGGGLNASLKHGIAAIAGRGAGSLVIVPSDAPLASAEELRDLVDTGATSDIVVVPAERDGGTNGLFLSPPDLIEPRFGESSLSAFVSEAEEAKLRCAILPLEGLAIDIDTVEDVDAILARGGSGSRAIALLRELRDR